MERWQNGRKVDRIIDVMEAPGGAAAAGSLSLKMHPAAGLLFGCGLWRRQMDLGRRGGIWREHCEY